ncbi:hypothetical protein SAMN02745165_02915 [Malonomonas rubra DSM 5091]|uniref:Uncharacterized protein n=1 Tax=Malonomonas rubra DSM 5091 TaxID=1122189 RepID=A0A1M6L8R4_MALRU|nr:hypothetical protein [Malonomonas rubra]SHJ67534.1 hypothetical protein SAMN02745165_02915 [Malonomonas rubra DSM 5091]
MTEKQTTANKKNALKSTGPKTSSGKEVSSLNSLRHGILSNRMLIEGEDPLEFSDIMKELQHDLKPTGFLEKTLVEKIAIILWRQKRILAAESAMIKLHRQENELLKQVNRSLGLQAYSSKAVSTDDLIPLEQQEHDSHAKVLEEISALWGEGHAENLTPGAIKKHAPILWSIAESWAKEDLMTTEEYFDDYLQDQTLLDWLEECRSHSYNELKRHERQPLLASLYDSAIEAASIPDPITRENLTRYQVSLDNQLYKAMKAFWQQQEMRQRRSIDVTPGEEVV